MESFIRFVAIILILANVQRANCEQKLFYIQSNSNNNALLSVSWDERENEINPVCDVISVNEKIEEALTSANYPPTETITEDELEEYLDNCNTVNDFRPEEGREVYKAPKAPNSETTESSGQTTPGYDGIPVIFPGTKWCGAGDRAKSYDDLGVHQDTDRCCRAHDLCDDIMAPGETRRNLTNKSTFTALSCQCDEDFYNCLDRVNTVTSNTIGNVYFNVLRRQCYKEDYPDSKKCKKSFLRLKCLEYEKDMTAPKVYRWVPAKKYRKIPVPIIDVELPFRN